MKKAELKDRLRRRTADKLYDLARTTGRMHGRRPADEPETTCQIALPTRRARAKRQPDPEPTR